MEHLAARVDQRREPVEGNEILNVIQRRLLAKSSGSRRRRTCGGSPSRRVYSDAARLCTKRLRAATGRGGGSGTPRPHQIVLSISSRSHRHHAGTLGGDSRISAHPWCLEIPSVLPPLRPWHAGHSRMLLGPGDVPIQDAEVRLSFFKEVGQREDFQPCLEHDFVGANARTRRIDDRRAREK